MKVLYINHVSPLAGSSRSLLELINCISVHQVSKYMITPDGEFADEIEKKGIPVIRTSGVAQFCNTEYGYYRKTRWLILIREIYFLIISLFIYYRAKKKWGNFDIIHLNEITLFPNIFILNLYFKKVKYVLHVRSIQRYKQNFLSKILNLVYKKYVNVFITIDKNVNESLKNDVKKIIIHNSLDPRNVKKSKKSSKIFTVGMVGLLNKSKGCSIFIETAYLAKLNNFKIRFILYGDLKLKVRFVNFLKRIFNLNENNSDELKKLITKLNLSDYVKILPFEKKLNKIYNSFDVLCFPSFLLSPGRPIFEAGFYKLPSIAAVENPKDDTIIDNVTGLIIKPNSSFDLIEKILILKNDKDLRNKLGKNAAQMSLKNFNAQKNAKLITLLYKNTLKKNGS